MKTCTSMTDFHILKRIVPTTLIVSYVFSCSFTWAQSTIDLSGKWQFRIDLQNEGIVKHTAWNGMIGKSQLQAAPKVRVDEIQVYPDS